MKIFTVHEPPQRSDDVLEHTAKFKFVRDGFYFWAFLLTPLWMLRHRMWLVFIGYIIVMTGVAVGLRLLGTSETVQTAVFVLLSLLIGIEAATLRRFSLRRWNEVGVVVGDDVEAAERRFFDGWVGMERGGHVPPMSAMPPSPMGLRPPGSQPGSHDIIGLFPEPGTRP
jgi:hypothetical protein